MSEHIDHHFHNKSTYLKICPVHGKTVHRRDKHECIKCHPKEKNLRGLGEDMAFVAKRRAVEDHQERLKTEDWWG